MKSIIFKCKACKNNESIRKQIAALASVIFNFLATEIKSKGNFFFTTPPNLGGMLATRLCKRWEEFRI